MISPDRLHSQLDWLTIPGPAPSSVDSAVHAWHRQAVDTLSSPFLVTEHALRRTAGDVSLICRTAVDVLDRAQAAGTVESPWMGDARAMLSIAAASWQRATVWPEHLRLGGRSVPLRAASGDLTTALNHPLATLDPAAQVAVISAALNAAAGIGTVHERATARLLARGGLWVATRELPSDYLDANSLTMARWAPKPTGSVHGHELAEASREANKRLGIGIAELAKVPVRRGFPAGEPEWETVAPQQARPQRREGPPMCHPASDHGVAI